MYERQASDSDQRDKDEPPQEWRRIVFVCLTILLWIGFILLVVLEFICGQPCLSRRHENIVVPSIVVLGAISVFCTGVVCLNGPCGHTIGD